MTATDTHLALLDAQDFAQIAQHNSMWGPDSFVSRKDRKWVVDIGVFGKIVAYATKTAASNAVATAIRIERHRRLATA